MSSLYRRAALLLLLIFGAARFAKWGAVLRGDEVHMLRYYCVQPVSFIRSHYEAPNNHVLLALLLHALDELSPTKLIGTMASVRPLQLPSILASIAALVLLFATASEFFNPPVALFSLAVFCASWWHLIFSHMLRAYSLSAFFNLLNIYLLQQILLRRRAWLTALLPFSLAAAHYLLPINAEFTAALGLWTVVWVAQRGADRRQRGLLLSLGAAVAIGLGLTAFLYAPILQQVLGASSATMTWKQSFAASGERIGEMLRVLGWGSRYRVFWLAFAFGGACVCVRARRWRAASVLLIGSLAIPLIFGALQRNIAPTRVYIVLLPIWSMLFGLGLYGPLLGLRKRMRLSHGAMRAATLSITAAIVAVSAGQVYTFLQFDRGLDLHGVVLRALPHVKIEDDAALIFAYAQEPDIVGSPSWEYYGFGASMLPYERTHRDRDYDYLARRRYLIAAETEAKAREVMRRTRVDRFLAATLRAEARVGVLTFYAVILNSSVIAAYGAALTDQNLGSGARVEALTGLGVEAIRAGDLRRARRLLLQAKGLSPADDKVRFQLGLSYYLEADPRAGAEFKRLIARNPHNIHARLYYAETLADRGQVQEAAQWLRWYIDGPDQIAEAWILRRRAVASLEALRAGRARVVRDVSSPERCRATADAYARNGSYERAAVVLSRISSFRRLTVAETAFAGLIQYNLHRYAAARQLLGRAVAQGAGPDAQLNLAMALKARQEIPEALELAASLQQAYPNDPQVNEFLRTVERL